MARIEAKHLRALFPGREDLCFMHPIEIADRIVDDLVSKTSTPLPANRDADICLYLAAHFTQIAIQDGALSAQTLGEATERYHNTYAPGLRVTTYGQHAIMLDPTGYLAQMAAAAEDPRVRPAEFRVI